MNPVNKLINKFLVLSVTLISSLGALRAQDGAAIFKQNCGACHRVGGGRLVGPDLQGVTYKRSEDWLMKWVKSSQSFIKSGDPEAKKIYEEFNSIMPDQNLPDADLKAILAFISAQSSGATASTDTSKKTPPAPDASNSASPEVIAAGRSIFMGTTHLTNGGPACISCHNVNYSGMLPGGLLAKDLTTVYSRLGGDAGIQGILGAPPFPAMTQAYKDKPITDQEIAAITAFLNKVDKDKANQVISSNPLAYGGPAGLAGILALIFIIWFRRKKATVKKDIYERQVKSI